MRKLIGAAWILAGSAAACLLVSGPALAADQTVEEFEAAQQAAWNAHDAGAYAAAFDANAEIVTSLGWHWNGQAEAARNLGDGFKFVYARAHLLVSDIQIRALTPELASVTLHWSIDGAQPVAAGRNAGGQHGLETQLLQRRGNGWVVLSQQDTASSEPITRPAVVASSQSPRQAAPAATSFPTTPPPVRRCIVGRANGDCLIYGKAR